MCLAVVVVVCGSMCAMVWRAYAGWEYGTCELVECLSALLAWVSRERDP